MKAAVLHQFGQPPRYEDFPDPVPTAEQQLVCVKAVPLENVDKAVANGTHFASSQFMPTLPAIVGFDGLGTLEDGSLVGFGGIQPPYGAMSEKTVITKGYTVPVPQGIDPIVAAALPAPALTGLFPLKWGAQLRGGEAVLINGATGVAGKLAVQIARLLGAGRVIGTGRHPESLDAVRALGADDVIDLRQEDAEISAAFARAVETGIDVILDFLWGHPTELLIGALVPRELGFAKRRVRLIQIGEMAGPTLTLSADSLRTSGLEIVGGAAGLTPEAIGEGTAQVWEWVRADKLKMDIEIVPLRDIERAWTRTDVHGKRLVIVP